MEVDTDDDILESSNLTEARSKGPPPDVTHHLPLASSQQQQQQHQQKQAHSNNSASYAKKTRTNSQGEYQPLLTNSGAELTDDQMESSDFIHLSCNHFDNDPEFNEIVKQVEFAIDHDVLPQRIYEGSSGSYFAKNSDFVSLIAHIRKIKTHILVI